MSTVRSRLYREAFESTAELLRREPDDPQRIFDHAQNVFYVGDVARQRGDTRTAEASLHEYKRLATKLIATDPSKPEWQMEGIYADTNLGILLLESGRYGEAATVFENSLADREKLAANAPDDVQFRKALISVLAWLAEAREKEGRLDDGLAQRERQISLLQPYINDTKSDAQYRREALVAYRAAGRLNTVRGNPSKGLEQLRTAVRIGEELTEAEPQNTDWAAMTAYAKFELARFELAQRNIEQAAALGALRLRHGRPARCEGLERGRLAARPSRLVPTAEGKDCALARCACGGRRLGRPAAAIGSQRGRGDTVSPMHSSNLPMLK